MDEAGKAPERRQADLHKLGEHEVVAVRAGGGGEAQRRRVPGLGVSTTMHGVSAVE